MTDAARGGPLAGVKVVEIAGVGPVPHACMTLADLGAQIIRIDRPSAPQIVSQANDIVHRGRPALTLDLKQPDATDAVLRLVENADVLVEGFRPGVMERLGLSPEECHARNPRLIYARMTGWGQDGPLASSAGHDLTYLALSGVLHGLGQDVSRPQFPSNLLGDYGGGSTYLVIGIVSALFESTRTGRGQVVDAAIVDGVAHLSALTMSLLADGQIDEAHPQHVLNGGAPFYSLYETADGRHMAVGALEPAFFTLLVHTLDLADVCPDQGNVALWERMRELFANRFRERTQAEWSALFEGTDACVAPVLSLAEAAAHPHLRSRNVYRIERGVMAPAPAPRFIRSIQSTQMRDLHLGGASDSGMSTWNVPDVDALLRHQPLSRRVPRTSETQH